MKFVGICLSHIPSFMSIRTSMNSNRRVSLLSLLFYLLLIINSLVSATDSSSGVDSQNGKVSLELYYETLCPYCSNFIVNYLPRLFENNLISAVDLKLIPYGNARIGPNNTITCQHGPSECLLNTVEACAIDVWPELNEHFQFIYCVETLVYEHEYPQWETCFEKLGLDPKLISDCYASGYGTKLELKYAAETNSLVPPHQYVPWVVVDGQPLYEDYENFISYICKAYKGTAVPEACSNISLITNHRVKSEPTVPVCDKETASLPTRTKPTILSWARKMSRVAASM
ncbi:Gamma-interferon-inducible lysosomal thiol reductase [Melia azedarach]|uniref:Gamma-interferon-inducible lysosomal thiol reductase n=1 Tax=Melia azedarach TaxID=155640 RepID=A0ACC1YQR7_MELAZ|nr:Gamma-interferon-inducible lysosomal thiol reductase [Melia azedarach]